MTEQAEPERKRMLIFRGEDAVEVTPEMMPVKGVDDSARAGMAKLAAVDMPDGVSARSQLLFSEPGDQGMSLLYVWFKSGYLLPFHAHETDCLYYVLGGELRIGSHVLHKGDGMFIPANHPYGYEAGPEGVEVLEYRSVNRLSFVMGPNDEQRWDRIASICRDRVGIWGEETVPPSER